MVALTSDQKHEVIQVHVWILQIGMHLEAASLFVIEVDVSLMALPAAIGTVQAGRWGGLGGSGGGGAGRAGGGRPGSGCG